MFLDRFARKLGVLELKGNWDASTNTPTLSSSVGTRGEYYIVSGAGSTNLNGITEWTVGDWVLFENGAWQRLNTADSEKLEIDGVKGIFTDSKEPTGFVNSSQTTISFNESTRTFTIAPTATSYDVYIKGVKQTISSTLNLTIPNTTGSYFIYIDTAGALQYQTTFDVSVLSEKIYTGYIYWNAASGVAVSYGDERHGLTMDSATHGYLHSTRGTQLASGAAIGYTSAGTGSSNADAQISVGDATVRDEDISAAIRNSATPTANFEQILSPIAEIPVVYKSGTAWTRLAATQYPIHFGTNRAQYNLNTSGTWSLHDASADGKFLVSYIFASTNVKWPIFALLGQAEYSTLDDAKANATWEKVNFGDLPFQEFKLCYIVIYETSSAYTNAVKSAIRYVSDVRFAIDREVSAIAMNTAHSNLSGLSQDDHTQYLLVSGARAMSAALDMGTHKISNVVDPTLNQDAATKKYTDDGLALKEPTITAGTTAQYWRGDKSWQTLDKSAVGLSNVDNVSAANLRDRSTHTGTQLASTISDFTTAVQGVTIDAAKIDGGVVSNAEFATLDGITTGVSIQSQINAKANLSGGNTFTGKQVMTPSASDPGLNIGVVATDPSAPANGDGWYNSTNHDVKYRKNGVTITDRNYLNKQVITTGTTYTPTAGAKYIEAILVGAGGGGGGVTGAGTSVGTAGGGGAGAMLVVATALTGAATYTCAIGALGAGGAAGANNGSAGTATTLTIGATTYSAAGGSGGTAQTAGTTAAVAAGGAGGTLPTGGTINVSGANGHGALRVSGVAGLAGRGADSMYGAGGLSPTTAAAGNAAAGYGAGGSGAYSTAGANRAGGNGAPGVIIITEYA